MNPTLLDVIDICEARHKGNAESIEAFESTKETSSRKRLEVLKFVEARGDAGATVDEIAAGLPMPLQTVSGRASELKAIGRLIDSGLRRKTRNGRNAAVLIRKEANT